MEYSWASLYGGAKKQQSIAAWAKKNLSKLETSKEITHARPILLRGTEQGYFVQKIGKDVYIRYADGELVDSLGLSMDFTRLSDFYDYGKAPTTWTSLKQFGSRALNTAAITGVLAGVGFVGLGAVGAVGAAAAPFGATSALRAFSDWMRRGDHKFSNSKLFLLRGLGPDLKPRPWSDQSLAVIWTRSKFYIVGNSIYAIRRQSNRGSRVTAREFGYVEMEDERRIVVIEDGDVVHIVSMGKEIGDRARGMTVQLRKADKATIHDKKKGILRYALTNLRDFRDTGILGYLFDDETGYMYASQTRAPRESVGYTLFGGGRRKAVPIELEEFEIDM